MDASRRYFLKALGGTLALSLTDLSAVAANELTPGRFASPINIIMPRDYRPAVHYRDGNYRARLTRAILDLLETHYGTQTLPVWQQRFGAIDLEKRVSNILYWMLIAVREYESVYPVDPAWAMAQIMKESYFYEFAVSRSLAVGICQFIQPTAESYGMLCAGTRPEHRGPAYAMNEHAGRAADYYELRRERNSYRRRARPAREYNVNELLEMVSDGASGAQREAARKQLAYLQKRDEYYQTELRYRDQFRDYLRANVRGRDIFNDRDLQFILGFDERFTYKSRFWE